ncbi:MAG: tetratricopeptide repeat protein [Tepidisphaeraceae bacterium]
MEKPGSKTVNVQEALDLAVQHHQAGRLREAEEIYRQVLLADPNSPHALHLLGVLASQMGQGEAALDFIRRAITLNPTAGQYHASLGAVLATLGRIPDAIEVYQRALVLQPDLLEAHANLGTALMKIGKFELAIESLQTALGMGANNFKLLDALGSALSQAGRHEQAVEILQQALALQANFAPTHLSLGNALMKLNRMDEAVTAYRAALAIRPEYSEALRNLSGLLSQRGAVDEAIDLARRSLALEPDSAHAWYNLGRCLHQQNRLDEAADALRRALALESRFPQAYNELGDVLLKMKAFDQAIESFNRSLEIEPSALVHYRIAIALLEQDRREEAIAASLKAQGLGLADHNLFNTLGALHHQTGEIDEAIDFFRQALAIQPDFPPAQWNLGLLQLLKGEFREGWLGYEARWRANGLATPARYRQRGLWDGGDLKDRRILLDCEQGFSDCIQFVRYIPLIAQRGGKPILTAFPELRRLFRTVPCLDEIICPPEEIPPFDVQSPLGSLGRLFETTLQNIPANVPYLFADPVLADRWRARIPRDGRIKIGLVWSGKAGSKDSATHSPGLASLAPLGAVPNTWFCSLQQGPAAAETVAPPEALQITDWTAEFQDFADTASLIANLDLVIGCDSAVAHVAGAMGKPLWLVLPFVPDWRWLLDRDDSPWYPTMRLFRQSKIGDWHSPIRRICRELGKLAKP